ncbi:A/G-specific adenine glycosylase [Sphingomonas jinjuensis]|uniref:A/G-specific adenine glycosylase n=1 Tax=Sphingomonas jinjuensis TaxID=535907 RepID=UPI001FEBA370|nr:A/G-specific adenine glycosylase [Sphingomonas jinjuensis]
MLAWYDAHRRDLPWRAPPGVAADPYRVWLSEVMLQQTTVATVRPRFEAWVARWPDFASLAAAEDADVMAAWAGLGYYARARNLVAAAKAVAADHGGAFPRTEAALRTLPGLGAYTAAAVAAIAFGERAVVVDANVERVVSRLFAIARPLPASRSAIRAAADGITPDERAGDFAQAMMDLGSAICTPKLPRCLLCPLQPDCRAQAQGEPDRYPVKAAKKAKPHRYGTIFWVERPFLSIVAPLRVHPSPVRAELVEAQELGAPPATHPSTSSGRTELVDRAVRGAREVLLVRRPPKGLLGGMRALPTGPWADEPPGLAKAPVATDWTMHNATVEHGFTHFDLTLALAVANGDGHHPDGEWWPLDRLDEAGLPTLFAKAARALRRDE